MATASQPPQRLLPGRLRPAAIAAVAICAAVLAAGGFLGYHGTRPDALDRAVVRFLSPAAGTPAGTDLAAIARLGGLIPMTVLTALLCYCCLATRRYRGAVLLAVSVLAASGLTELVLKPLIDRTYAGFLSFPSGHATGVFALVAGIAVVLATGPRNGRALAGLRVVLAAGALALGCAVAIGLVIARMHYFTDTIGGAAAGIGVTLTVALGLDLVSDRRSRPGPAPAWTGEPGPDRVSSHRG